MSIRSTIAAAALAVAAAAGLALTAGAAQATTGTVHATTKITGRPDSGVAGDWADDAFTRSVSLTFGSEVNLSHCGGTTSTGHCYHWTAKITDAGTFTTIVGQDAPGVGYMNGGATIVNGVAATGPMAGSYNYDFYSSWKTANASLVPKTENDGNAVPTGRKTTGAWPEQFFGNGARFYVSGAQSDSLGTTGSWKYTLAAGADSACPNVTSQWIDGSPDWGGAAVDGQILAPDAAHC